MEAWRTVWRQGIATQLSTSGLTALAIALKADDPHLLQGATTTPPPLQCVQDWPVEACDAIAFTFVCHPDGKWRDTRVAEAEEFFARVCFACDELLGEPAACRWFLNYYDETPRDEMRRQLLPEVQRVLAHRAARERGGFNSTTPEEIVQDWIEENGSVFDANEMEAIP